MHYCYCSINIQSIIIFKILGKVLSNDVNLKTNLPKSLMLKDQTTIKNKGWLLHKIVNPFVIQRNKLVPFGTDGKSMRVLSSLVRIFTYRHIAVKVRRRPKALAVREVRSDLLLGYFWVINDDTGLFFQQVLGDVYTGRLTSVSCVFLECKPVYCYLLT